MASSARFGPFVPGACPCASERSGPPGALGFRGMRRLRFLLLRLRLWYKKRRRGYYDLRSDEAPPAERERDP